MKELSTEEKAKAYDEAINRMRHYVVDEYGCSRIKVADVFPELKESEDEKIRKELIRAFTITADKRDYEIYGNGITYKQVLAWLEKQGEQKPVEWHREDEQNLNACFGYIPDEFLRRWLQDIIHTKYDKAVWTEEDEKTIHLACEFIRHHSNHNDSIGGIDCSILIERLKSLRSQSQWKPSDEQMERLKGTINSLPHQEVLYSLYQDLKKLKGE